MGAIAIQNDTPTATTSYSKQICVSKYKCIPPSTALCTYYVVWIAILYALDSKEPMGALTRNKTISQNEIEIWNCGVVFGLILRGVCVCVYTPHMKKRRKKNCE